MTKNKTAVVSSGRFQGIHHGHALLVNKTVSHAKSIGADHYIYPTRTQDNDKNPIEHNEKVSIMRGLFPQANIASDSDVRNPIEAVKKMSQKGYRHVKLIAGQDRIPQFQASIGAYVKKKTDKDFDPKKHIDLDSFEVVSAGDRDPDAEGVQGASGTKMREYVRKGDFGSFAKSVPTNNAKLSRRMFNAMRKGMAVKQLKEEVTRKELAPMLDSFVSFASDKLGLKSMPNIRYKTEDDDYNSFAAYNPSSNELSIHTMNRHPMDIFRSIAHELVHHKQNEDGRLGKDIAKEGATGSDIENEANSEAGKIMRWFAKANPDMFNKTYVVETNTAAMGGVRGLGNVTGEVSPTEVSQYVLDNQAYTQQLQNNNTEQLYTFNDDNSWMDKKGKQEYQAKSLKAIRARAQLNEGINDPGKLKAIFLAGGPGSGKDYVMNATLAGEGLKEINSDVAFEYLMQKNGLDLEMPDEERVERDIVRGRAKNITKEQERLALAGRLGLIINGTADDLEKIKRIKKELEADGYETMMVFVNTSNEVSRERNVERGKMGKRKVPDGTDKQGVPDNSPNVRQEKWDLAQKNIGELQKIFGNENFAVIDNTADIRKVGPEEKEKIQINFNRIRRMAQQFVRSENKNPAAKAWIDREVQKRGITQYQEPKRYKTLTQVRQDIPQVVHKPDNELMAQARRLGLSYYGFGRFGRKVNGVNKVMYHSKGGKLVRVQLNEDLSKWFREKWVRFDTKGNIKGPCAREPGEGKPKCRPLASARAMSKEERAKSARRKRREDPVADRSGKGNKPIMVKTESVQTAIDKINRDRMSEEMLMEKNKPTNPALWSKAKSLAKQKFDVYPSAYANGWAAKWYKSKGGGWTSVNEEKKKKTFMSHKGKPTRNLSSLDEKFEEFMSNPSNREIGTTSLADNYKNNTPGQSLVPVKFVVEKKKKVAKKLKREEVNPIPALPTANGIGPEISQYRPMVTHGFTYGIAESIQSWMDSPRTQQKFADKYGNLWEEKLVEAALRLDEAGCGSEQAKMKKKSVKEFYDASKSGLYSGRRDEISEMQEDQLNERGADSRGLYRPTEKGAGLTPKGAKYFGVKTAVTTPPSKLDPKGKAAKRRKSFCARMGGMPGPMKDEKGRPTRKAMSLRRWNCEE
jgi:hypothetical protein